MRSQSNAARTHWPVERRTHRDRHGRAIVRLHSVKYSGIYKTSAGNYRCIIQWRKTVYHLGTTADEETAVVMRDRVARHLGCPERMLNLPGRRLKPMPVEEAKAKLDRAAKAANPGRYLGVQKTRSGRYKSVIQWKNEVHWLGEAATQEKAVWIRERVARHLGCPRAPTA